MGRKTYHMVQRRPALLDHFVGCRDIFTFGSVMDISCWRDVRAVYPPSRPPFLFLHRNWIQRKMDVPLRFGWHISLAAAARCAFRLSRAASASGKRPALMGLGGGARVQSIPRAANRICGAEDTR